MNSVFSSWKKYFFLFCCFLQIRCFTACGTTLCKSKKLYSDQLFWGMWTHLYLALMLTVKLKSLIRVMLIRLEEPQLVKEWAENVRQLNYSKGPNMDQLKHSFDSFVLSWPRNWLCQSVWHFGALNAQCIDGRRGQTELLVFWWKLAFWCCAASKGLRTVSVSGTKLICCLFGDFVLKSKINTCSKCTIIVKQ